MINIFLSVAYNNIFLWYIFSNVDVPEPVIQSLKKRCNPSFKKKSFKERNPDLDMEEIQNNPNIPDDIKAVLSGSVLEEAEAIEENAACVKDSGVEAMISQKYDDLLNEDSDEEIIQSKRKRKSKKEDDEWFASKKERMEREKQINGPRRRGRPKRKSDEGTDDKVKRKKRTPKKKTESTRKSTESSKPQPVKSKVAKVPPALPFSLLDLTKKFEGKIPSLKNSTASKADDVEPAKRVVVELVNPKTSTDIVKLDKSTISHNYMDRVSQSGISSVSPLSTVTSSSSNNTAKQIPLQNGSGLYRRPIPSSTISSKDYKSSETAPSKYPLMI